MKKIVSTLIAGLMAFSLVVMGCSNDSSSDNTALMLLVSASSASSGSGSSGGTKPAGGAVNALSGAQAGATVDLSEYELSDKIALTVDKAITVKNAILNGGYITVSAEATLDNVDGGTIVLVGNGKNATLKDCDAKNVIVKEAEGSRGASDFTLKINGGVVENIVNDGLNLTIQTTKTTIKKLITKQSLVINSTEESKIELISASAQITLAGKLVIEKAVSENTVKVASNTVSIKKGNVEIVADDSEYAEDNLNIETIKAAVGELTDSESKEISNTLEAVQKEAEEMNSNIQAAEDEANKALEEYKKAVVTFYLVDEGQVLHEENVPLAEVEKALETLTASIPEGGKIELFSDEACTTPVDVTTIKAGDKIYIKYPEYIPGEPDVDLPVVIVNGENVPLSTMIEDLENGQSFYINGEVNMEDANAWLPMTGNVFIFEYNEKMNAWGSKTGSVKVNMTRNAAENPYENGVKVSVWDKSENISWADTAISLDGLVQGKTYALVMTNSTQANNTDGKGKHVELYEVVMNGSMGE